MVDLKQVKATHSRMDRKSVRAPVRMPCLFTAEGPNVFKGIIENISVGGCLLSELPCIPSTQIIHVLGVLPVYPEFSTCTHKELLELHLDQLETVVFRANLFFVREQKIMSEVDEILTSQFGCKFQILTDEQVCYLNEYTHTFAKNIVYLLNFIESNGHNKEGAQLIRHLLGLLRYDVNLKFSLIRQDLLHDYHNLTIL